MSLHIIREATLEYNQVRSDEDSWIVSCCVLRFIGKKGGWRLVKKKKKKDKEIQQLAFEMSLTVVCVNKKTLDGTKDSD